MKIRKIDVKDIPELTSDEGAWLNLDNAYYENQKLIINGWFVIQGRETNPVSMHVLLGESGGGEYYELPTAIVTREDVTAYFNDNINYDNSGFSVAVNFREFDLKSSTYEIFLLYTIGDEEYIIRSNNVITSESEGNS